jgi:hypothetical protein
MRKAILLVSLASLAALVLSQTAFATHAHPANNGAPGLNFSVVPQYQQCLSPAAKGHHGTPLAGPSCGPTKQTSPLLTTGGAGTFKGVSTFGINVTCAGGPPPVGTCSGTEDVALTASATDVRCKPGSAIFNNATLCPNTNQAASGKDYAGQVQGNAQIRITDAYNSQDLSPTPQACSSTTTCHATVVDLPFPVTGTCAATADATIGGTCSVATTANAVVPGVVKKGKQAIVGIGQVIVNDGGADGLAATAPNNLFAVQGIYIP